MKDKHFVKALNEVGNDFGAMKNLKDVINKSERKRITEKKYASIGKKFAHVVKAYNKGFIEKNQLMMYAITLVDNPEQLTWDMLKMLTKKG